MNKIKEVQREDLLKLLTNVTKKTISDFRSKEDVKNVINK